MTDPTDGRAPYETILRVRFDEAGPDGRLRTSNLLRYAQDLAWLHSAELGFGRDWYAEHGLTWLVRAAGLAVVGPVEVGSTIVGDTRVVGFRRVWSRRRSAFRDGSGATVAVVDTDWVLLDGRGAPTRVPDALVSRFEPTDADERLTLGRVALDDPPPDAVRGGLVVRPQELDPMDHVNNAVYADWLDEAVIGAGDPSSTRVIPRWMAIEYATAAAPLDALATITWPTDRGWACRIEAGDGGRTLARATLERAGTDPA